MERIREVAIDDRSPIREADNSTASVASTPATPISKKTSVDAATPASASAVAASPASLGSHRYVLAVEDHNATDSSELSFKAGDRIIFGTTDRSGYIFGTLNDESGWFPQRCVQEVPLAGAKPLFSSVTEDESVVQSPISKEDAARTLEQGLVHRPAQAELERKVRKK